MFITRSHFVRTLFSLLVCTATALPAMAAEKPLKVFILVGQSNMEGHARVETFDYIGDDPKTAPLLKKMRNADGTPRVCDGAWISYYTGRGGENGEGYGKLTAGYGSRPNPSEDGGKIGPEFTFGITMDEAFEEPVLIIKTAWGGKSLFYDFRPPSAGVYPPLPKDSEGNRFAKYSGWMADFIRDVRKGLDAPKMSFVIGVVGVGGKEANEGNLEFCKAMAEEASPIRVACLGDSITAGARVDAKSESYPARLQTILGDNFEVRNFGIGGATLIKTGRPNIWRNLDAVKQFEPHIAIIFLGTNDTVGGSRKNWEQIERFDDDYSELIKTLDELPSKPRIVLCTPTAMVLKTTGLSEERLANLTERKPRLQELCERIRKLAAKHADQKVSLLELNAVLQDRPELLSEGDGVHPNAEGYSAIARAVAEHIRPQKKRPNIVLFLVDDMGWQDTSVPFHTEVTDFNRRYRTPHMEQLAKAGMKFTQAYACSVCSPTRVSLMTGLNAARHRVTNWTLRKNASNDRGHPQLAFPLWNVNGLSPEPDIERTVHAKALPAYLSEAGYRTIHVGKAHFGAIGTPGSDPRNVGFDVNIAGHAAGGPGSFLGKQDFSAVWRKGDRVWDVPGLESCHGKDIFLTEALTIEANKAVDQAVADGKPFFLYMSHYAVHVPFAVDSRFYQKYRDGGLDHTEAMYAAMVEGMDKSLGDILANVERHGLSDETIVLFMSDNGGLSAHGRGGKPHTHNKPLSSGKGSAHEGGVRVPMIVSWPGVTKAGSVCQQPVIIEDFFSTILEIAGVFSFEQIGGVVDGRSFVNLLRGEQDETREDRPLIWHFPNNWGPKGPGIGPSSAIRLGAWKLIYYHESQQYELFNLAEDLGEQNNLADKQTEVIDLLATELGEYLASLKAQMPIMKASGEPVPYPGSAVPAGKDR